MCVCDCEGGDFSVEKSPPSRSLPKRREGWEDAGGEAASLREAPLPQTPSPEERLALGLCLSSGLVPPERWEWFPVAWLWSRRLTEPPRPANVWFRHQSIKKGPEGGRGRSKSCQTGSVPRLASADAKSLSPQGRGGSVSRRDLTLAYRRSTALAWALNAKRATKPIPSHSSGGGPGRRFS